MKETRYRVQTREQGKGQVMKGSLGTARANSRGWETLRKEKKKKKKNWERTSRGEQEEYAKLFGIDEISP